VEAYIISFKRGGNTQNQRQVIIEVPGVEGPGEAARLIGRKIVWRNPVSSVEFRGKIVRLHGRRGRLVAYFRKPLPGQAIGTKALLA